MIRALPPPAATVWVPLCRQLAETSFHKKKGEETGVAPLSFVETFPWQAQVVRKLLQPKRHWFQELILQHEKRDVPYGICFIRKKQLTYPTSSHRSKQRSRMKINWNQVRKPVLQPQIDANNEKYPYLSFVNHIPQDPGECACRIKETDFICPHQQY